MKKEINDWEVLTPNGWSDFKGIRRLESNNLIEIHTSDNQKTICTSTHLLKSNNKFIPANKTKNKLLNTKNNPVKVVNINRLDKKYYVYDLLDVEKNNEYYTNNIISHNCARIPSHLIDPFWEAVIPVVSSGSTTKIFLVSTPLGARGKFYEIYQSAVLGKFKEWKAERIDWWEIPGRGKKWKSQMIESLGGSEDAFQQEFGNVFLDYGKCAVDTEILNEYKNKARPPEIILEDGNYKIWNTPQDNRIYLFGVDVGEGIGNNSSVINILDVTDLTHIELCGTYSNNKIDPSSFANKIFTISQQWGNPYLAIERNNCGAETLSVLQNTYHYPHLITHLPERQQQQAGRTGIYSHTSLKYKAVTNMRYWMNTKRSVKIYDIETIKELENFVQYENNTWKSKQGVEYTDDRVTSLMWGLFVLITDIAQQYFEVVGTDEQGKPLKIIYSDKSFFDIHRPNNTLMGTDMNDAMPSFFGPGISNLEDPNLTDGDLLMSGWRYL